jgi:hypothetical protein
MQQGAPSAGRKISDSLVKLAAVCDKEDTKGLGHTWALIYQVIELKVFTPHCFFGIYMLSGFF